MSTDPRVGTQSVASPPGHHPASPLQVLTKLRITSGNIQPPATVSEEVRTQVVGFLLIIPDFIISLQAEQERSSETIVTLQQQFEELQQENHGLESNAVHLGADLERSNTTIDLLQRSPVVLPMNNLTSSAPKQQNIANPERFMAERKELKSFLSQVRLKLHGNESMFPTVTILLLSSSATGNDSCLLGMRVSFSCTKADRSTIVLDSTRLTCLS